MHGTLSRSRPPTRAGGPHAWLCRNLSGRGSAPLGEPISGPHKWHQTLCSNDPFDELPHRSTASSTPRFPRTYAGDVGMSIRRAGCERHLPKELDISIVVAHRGRLFKCEPAGGEDLLRGTDFVGHFLPQMTDPQLLRPLLQHLTPPACDQRNLQSNPRSPHDSGTIFDIEDLLFISAWNEDDRAVGQHSVDVEKYDLDLPEPGERGGASSLRHLALLAPADASDALSTPTPGPNRSRLGCTRLQFRAMPGGGAKTSVCAIGREGGGFPPTSRRRRRRATT